MSSNVLTWDLLEKVAVLAGAPLWEIAGQLYGAIKPYCDGRALVIFTKDCTGRPQKKAGDEDFTSHVSLADLEELRHSMGTETTWLGTMDLSGHHVEVIALRDAPSDALLVIANPAQRLTASLANMSVVQIFWKVAARRIQEKVAEASPAYLSESRASSQERLRVTAELSDKHASTLETLLSALRSTTLGDAASRSTAAAIATKALIEMRTHNDRIANLAEEPVASAFQRLRGDLLPLSKHSGVDIEFIEPPFEGRALPGEVAHGARAVVRGLLLSMMEQARVSRIRVQWDCDGENLLIAMRDDGDGGLSLDDQRIQQIETRVQVFNGQLQLNVMRGWGTDVIVKFPVDMSMSPPLEVEEWNLGARELEVLELVVAGDRNRGIAEKLQISENTVKFHVRNIFKKMSINSRAEAIALAHNYGMR